MRLFTLSTPTPFQRVLGIGAPSAPEGMSRRHVGVPPSPLAWESTQVSPKFAPLMSLPPKIVIVLVLGK
jgi:hypothetical protein